MDLLKGTELFSGTGSRSDLDRRQETCTALAKSLVETERENRDLLQRALRQWLSSDSKAAL